MNTFELPLIIADLSACDNGEAYGLSKADLADYDGHVQSNSSAKNNSTTNIRNIYKDNHKKIMIALTGIVI